MSTRHRPRPEIPPDPKRSISLTEAERDALVGARPGSVDPALPGAWADLESAETARDVGAVLLAALAETCRNAVVLRPSRDELRGWLGHGAALDEARLRSLAEPIGDDPTLTALATVKEAGYLEVAPSLGLARVAACWQGGPPGELLVVPIRVSGRLVALALGEPSGDERIPAPTLDTLADRCASAFSRLLAQRRPRFDD